MYRNRIYRGVSTEEEFKTFLSTAILLPKVTTPPTGNQWMYDHADKSAHINNLSNIGYGTLPLGNLKIGDIVDIDVEIMSISGEKAALIINDSNGASLVKYAAGMKYFEKVSFRYVVTKDDSFSLTCGLGHSKIGEIKIRNLCVNLNVLRNTAEVRRASLMKEGSWQVNPYVNTDGFTVTENTDSIVVKFDNALPTKGVPFPGQLEGDYFIKTSGQSNDSVTIKIYNVSDLSTPVALSTIPNYTYLHVMLVG